MDSPAAAIVIDAIQFLHDRRRGRRSNRNDDQNHKKEHQLGTAALASWTLHHHLLLFYWRFYSLRLTTRVINKENG